MLHCMILNMQMHGNYLGNKKQNYWWKFLKIPVTLWTRYYVGYCSELNYDF